LGAGCAATQEQPHKSDIFIGLHRGLLGNET
jgi:hypothetical protein